MSYTKKQLMAFRDILAYCPADKCAVYKADYKYLVTDGSVCVVLNEFPEMGMPLSSEGEAFYDFCRMESENGDHTLVESRTPADLVTDCKLAIRQWREEKRHRKFGTPDQPRIQISGNGVSAWYDARKVINALTAVGPQPRVYIGRRMRGGFRIPTVTLIVSVSDASYPYAVVLPLRVEAK